VPGGITGPTGPGGYKYEDLALQVGGVSSIGTIKYDLESPWTALARNSSNSITDAFSRQRGSYKIINSQLSKENLEEKEKIGRWSQMGA
jgi:hypothetical protein